MDKLRFKTKVSIWIKLRDESRAQALKEALIPDDVALPQGMSISYANLDRELVIELTSEGDLFELKNTINDILLSLRPALELVNKYFNL